MKDLKDMTVEELPPVIVSNIDEDAQHAIVDEYIRRAKIVDDLKTFMRDKPKPFTMAEIILTAQINHILNEAENEKDSGNKR